MSHHFYLQNASRRSAQAFPISLAPGAKFSEAKENFSEMLGTPADQIIRLTTADGHIILPGQSIPDEPLILEVERRAFDRLTGAGTFAPMESMISTRTIASTIFPCLIMFVMFAGYTIILGGLASASKQCGDEDVASWLFTNLFAWGSNAEAAANGVNLKFMCGLSLSLFWFIISLELVICIIPGVILLVWAGSFSADTKGSWAYIITCTLNILTALLCIMAFSVVPGAYYARAIDVVTLPGNYAGTGTAAASVSVPADYVKAVEVMAAGVIILLVANFAWIYTQACGKMIPEDFQCCDMICGGGKSGGGGDAGTMSPVASPQAKAPTVVSV